MSTGWSGTDSTDAGDSVRAAAGRRGRGGRRDRTGRTDRTEYAAARWPSLVRTALLIGCGPDQARRLALEALSGSGRSGGGAATTDDGWRDPDVVTYAALRDAWAAERRRAGRPTATASAYAAEVLRGADDAVTIVSERLDGLDTDTRWRWVLRHVAGLEEEQVDEVVPTDGPQPDPPHSPLSGAPYDRRHDPGGLPALDWPTALRVLGPPPGPTLQPPGRRRRRRRLTVVVVTAVVLVVAGLVARSSLRPDPPRVAAAGVPVAWWASGVLHVGSRQIPIAGVRSLAELPGVVVLVDGTGTVAEVDTDGTVSSIGHARPGATVVGGDNQLLVAWIDPRKRALVVYDVGAHVPVQQIGVRGRAHVVAVDASNVFYRDAQGDHDLLLHAVDATVDRALLDVEAKVRASAVGRIRLLLSPRTGRVIHASTFARPARVRIAGDGVTPVIRPGRSVVLSPLGSYAAVLTGAGALDLVDLDDGRSVPLPLPAGEVTGAAFDPEGRAGFVLRTDDDIELVTCQPVARTCVVARRLPLDAAPVLAHW